MHTTSLVGKTYIMWVDNETTLVTTVFENIVSNDKRKET